MWYRNEQVTPLPWTLAWRVVLLNSKAVAISFAWTGQKIFRTVDEAARAGSPIPAVFRDKQVAQEYADYLNEEVGQ